jgi:hypothetical protein
MPGSQKLHVLESEFGTNLDFNMDDYNQDDMWDVASAQLANTAPTLPDEGNKQSDEMLALVQQYSKPTNASNNGNKPILPCYKFILNNGKCEDHEKHNCKYDHSPYQCAKFFSDMAERSNKLKVTPTRLNSTSKATNLEQGLSE